MFESKDHKNKWMYFWRKNCPAGPRAKLTFRVMIVWCNNHCALISRFTSFNERFDSSKWRDGVKMRALISPLSQGLVVLTVVGTDFQNIFIPFEIFFGRYHFIQSWLTEGREASLLLFFILCIHFKVWLIFDILWSGPTWVILLTNYFVSDKIIVQGWNLKPDQGFSARW